MKRMSIVGLCLLAALAMSAVFVSSASATAPEFGRCLKQTKGKYANSGCTKLAKVSTEEKFEWTPTILNNKFKAHMTGTLATLETVTGTKITCKAEKNENAEYTGEKSVAKIVADFTGCETGGIECANAGAGEIITNSLSGTLGYEKKEVELAKSKLEVQLVAESAATLAEFKCSTLTIKVTGCVAHPVSGGKMLKTATEKFTASKGEQKPDKFSGGPADECALASNNGAGTEESGQTITALVENAEPLGIEANPAV
jgi:hypothetical protein